MFVLSLILFRPLVSAVCVCAVSVQCHAYTSWFLAVYLCHIQPLSGHLPTQRCDLDFHMLLRDFLFYSQVISTRDL